MRLLLLHCLVVNLGGAAYAGLYYKMRFTAARSLDDHGEDAYQKGREIADLMGTDLLKIALPVMSISFMVSLVGIIALSRLKHAE